MATTAYVSSSLNGVATVSSGTSVTPQTFTGYNQFNNSLKNYLIPILVIFLLGLKIMLSLNSIPLDGANAGD